ncbi:MAG: hypothetical protein INR62_07100, partial [Rhodospirillales bacterium]|nr:hypothetical protein [Acetobacter sp.]
NHHWIATSQDGIHFTTVAAITTKGLRTDAGLPSWSDMALNPKDGYWYALFNLPYRASSSTGDVGESGQPGFQLYRIRQDDLATGSVGWEEMVTIDTHLTGYESNFLPALLQDGMGRVFQDANGGLQFFVSFSNVKLTWDRAPKDAAKDAVGLNWDINKATWSPKDPVQSTLNRYTNGSLHRVTTGPVDLGEFTLEKALGQVYRRPMGQATVALFDCKADAKNAFASLDAACEGSYFAGLNGYIYAEAPAGVSVVPLYRCASGQDGFLSNDPHCEGASTTALLGYALAPPSK